MTSIVSSTSLPLVDVFQGGLRLVRDLGGSIPASTREALLTEVGTVIESCEQACRHAGLPAKTIDDAVYALCAAIDEAVLASTCSFKSEWERAPLQLSRFGDQLAGEHFFSRLDAIRREARSHGDIGEFYGALLALGFKGRYALESSERLTYLTGALENEIAKAQEAVEALVLPRPKPKCGGSFLRKLPPKRWAACIVLSALISGTALMRVAVDREAGMRESKERVALPAQVARLKIVLP